MTPESSHYLMLTRPPCTPFLVPFGSLFHEPVAEHLARAVRPPAASAKCGTAAEKARRAGSASTPALFAKIVQTPSALEDGKAHLLNHA